MIVQPSDRSYVLVVIPGDKQLSLKAVGGVLGDKNVQMASQRDVQRVTGQGKAALCGAFGRLSLFEFGFVFANQT